MIDWSRINQLRQDVGESDFSEVIDIFLEEAVETLQRLGAGGDKTVMVREFHSLKGCAQSMGFDALATLCQSCERNLADGLPLDVNVQKISACYEESVRLFRAQSKIHQ